MEWSGEMEKGDGKRRKERCREGTPPGSCFHPPPGYENEILGKTLTMQT